MIRMILIKLSQRGLRIRFIVDRSAIFRLLNMPSLYVESHYVIKYIISNQSELSQLTIFITVINKVWFIYLVVFSCQVMFSYNIYQ